MLGQVFGRHGPEFARAIQRREWERTAAGIHFPRQGATLHGTYGYAIDGGRPTYVRNLITNEGLDEIAAGMWAPAARSATTNPSSIPNSYLTLWQNDMFPDQAWGINDVVTTAAELGDAPEGYNESGRVPFVAVGSGPDIDNFSSPAVFTLRTSGTIAVCGFALVSGSTKLETTGVVYNACRLDAAPMTFVDFQTLGVSYRLELS